MKKASTQQRQKSKMETRLIRKSHCDVKFMSVQKKRKTETKKENIG